MKKFNDEFKANAVKLVKEERLKIVDEPIQVKILNAILYLLKSKEVIWLDFSVYQMNSGN